MYNFDGKVKNCIRSVETMPIGNIQDDPIDQIVLGNENINRQISIVDQTPVPSCQTCYDLERGKKGFDIISDRIFIFVSSSRFQFRHISPVTLTFKPLMCGGAICAILRVSIVVQSLAVSGKMN
jgi:hypothetical protein